MNWDAIGTVVGGVLGLGNSIYNTWANQRDFDYQRNLQQQIFEREDTAVQRRMADLKAAGLNPNLATGQAAGAGAIVSRSNTNDVNFGAALDTMAAVQQIRNARVQNDIAKSEAKIKDAEAAEKIFDTLSHMGVDFTPYFDRDGKFKFQVEKESVGSSMFYFHGTEEKERQWQRNEENFKMGLEKALSEISKNYSNINLNTAQINQITNNINLSWQEFQLQCNKFELQLTEADFNMALKTYEELRKQLETKATIQEKQATIQHMLEQEAHMNTQEAQAWVEIVLNAVQRNKQNGINILSIISRLGR